MVSCREKDFESEQDEESGNAYCLLSKIKIENVNRIVIGSLKSDQLKEVIGKNLDVLTIQETKLDPSFPSPIGKIMSFRHSGHRRQGCHRETKKDMVIPPLTMVFE